MLIDIYIDLPQVMLKHFLLSTWVFYRPDGGEVVLTSMQATPVPEEPLVLDEVWGPPEWFAHLRNYRSIRRSVLGGIPKSALLVRGRRRGL